MLNGQTLIPAGSLVEGRIMQVKRPGRFPRCRAYADYPGSDQPAKRQILRRKR